MANVGLIINTPTQYMSYYLMMMQWYKENPSDGLRVARAMRVGLPLKDDTRLVDGEILGHAVPEADREIFALN